MGESFSWKKILIIIGFIVVICAVGYFIYTLFFKAAPETPAPKPTEKQTGQLPAPTAGTQPGVTQAPTATTPVTGGQPVTKITKVVAPQGAQIDSVAQGGVTKVKDLDSVTSQNVTLDSQRQGLRTYNPDTGQFYHLSANGEKTLLSKKIYKSVKNVTWSPGQDAAIMEFPDGSNVLYNFATDKQISLPKDWEEFNFNAAGNKIAFKDMNPNPDYRWLAVANADGSGLKYLEAMGNKAKDFTVNWSPSGQIVALFRGDGTLDTTQIYFVGQQRENFKSLTVNGYGVDTQWTPDGSRLLYSASNYNSDNKPELYIVDASGGDQTGNNHQSLKLNTWADKCAFANASTVYCAVPKELPSGANMVPEIADSIPDYIYKVDLKTGVKSFIAEPEYNYSIGQIQVNSDESALYFTDKLTQTVHTIKLK